MRELVLGLVCLPLLICPAAAKAPVTLHMTAEPQPGALLGVMATTVNFRRAMAAGCGDLDLLAGPMPGGTGPSNGNLTPRPSNKGSAASDLAPNLCLPL
jgi:hypothetical protein